jgi:hypothetical protein
MRAQRTALPPAAPAALPAPAPHTEASTLLLYTLLHGSRSFQEYVLVRSDPETLLLPLLQQLYEADKSRANHLYMLQVRVACVLQAAVAVAAAGCCDTPLCRHPGAAARATPHSPSRSCC